MRLVPAAVDGGAGAEATSRCQTQAVLPDPSAGTTGSSGTTGPSYWTLQEEPNQGPDDYGTTGPGTGTTAPSYRSLQATPTEAPGPPAVLPPPERYYRLRPVLPVARPVLPVLTEPERISLAQRPVPLPIFYLFVLKLPLFMWLAYI